MSWREDTRRWCSKIPNRAEIEVKKLVKLESNCLHENSDLLSRHTKKTAKKAPPRADCTELMQSTSMPRHCNGKTAALLSILHRPKFEGCEQWMHFDHTKIHFPKVWSKCTFCAEMFSVLPSQENPEHRLLPTRVSRWSESSETCTTKETVRRGK